MVKQADPWLADKRGEFGRHRPGLHSTLPPSHEETRTQETGYGVETSWSP